MTDKILLSIIIPIYNKEDYLPECLLSLKRQKFDYNVEILLVDDGSTDDSLRICNDITKKDVRYRIIVADFSFCPRFAHSKRRKLLLAFAA